jgi:hypothetical protein
MATQTSLSAATRGKRGEIRFARTRAASVRSSKRLPFAQGHPRKPLPYSDRSFPPSLLEGRGFHAFRVPTSPSGILSIKSRRFSSIPLVYPEVRRALTHPRNPSHQSDRSFLPSLLEGRGFIPSIKNREFDSVPLAPLHPRKPSSRVDKCEFIPLALTRPRNPSPCLDKCEFIPLALTHPRNPSPCLDRHEFTPLALTHPRNPSPCLDRHEFIPLALTHPRNPSAIQGARALVLRIKSHSPRVTDSFWPPWPARCGGRLIANARLKFSLSHRKISQLKISNRERIAIFQLAFQHRKSWPSPIVQRGECGLSPLSHFTTHESQVTRHRFLIGGSAIRNPCKALKT